MLEKLHFFGFDRSNNCVDVDVKIDRFVLEEKKSHVLRFWGQSLYCKLDRGLYIDSIAKTTFNKIGSLNCFYEVSFS